MCCMEERQWSWVQATPSWVMAELVRIFHDTTTKEAIEKAAKEFKQPATKLIAARPAQ
jgi:hypothetical protein